MAEPIKPSEIMIAKKKKIPDVVIESFNDMIAKNFNGIYSQFMQDETVALIVKKSKKEITVDQIFDNHWLDVEDIYRNVGWEVEYDKPAFNESYPASFTFQKREEKK